MDARILPQGSLSQLLDALAKDYELIAPVDESSYAKIESGQEASFGDDKPAKSPKEFFLPQREVLFRFALSAAGATVEDAPAMAAEQVIVGTRPCDAAALSIVDQVFLWDDVDAAYQERREKTVVVSLACQEPCDTCFCTSLGGSPAGIEGSDLLLTPLRDSYHVQIITERGQALVDRYERFFEQSDQRRNRERAALEDEWREKIADVVDLSNAEAKLEFDSDVWDKLTRECVDCGICTFLCPTCHCFDIRDEGNPNAGERVRLWDACMFFEYTKTHAGQPRPTHNRRYRQRIMHKFSYYPKNFGKVLCVGCGRCIEYCPVSIDLRAVLRAVQE